MNVKRPDAAKEAWSNGDGLHCSNSQSASLTEICPGMNMQDIQTLRKLTI